MADGALSQRRLVALLLALAGATFLVTASGGSLAPFMNVMARDLRVDFAAVALFFSLLAVVWGSAALLAGSYSDRLGRRVPMIVAVACMGLARTLFAWSPSYGWALFFQLSMGFAGGAFMGMVFASVSEHVPAAMRGRALGWVITGQSFSLLLAVPIIAYLGSLGGWRVALTIHGIALIVICFLLYVTIPHDPPVPDKHRHPLGFTILWRQPRLLLLLGAGATERLCYALVGIYFAAFLQHYYDASLRVLALALACVALGNLAGNLLGATIADRYPHRMRTFALASLATAVCCLPLMGLHLGLVSSVAFGFAYMFANALGRPALMATLAEVPPEQRGALFGLNVTAASMGWLLAAALGAWLITRTSFISLGVLGAIVSTLGAALAIRYAYALQGSTPSKQS